MNRRAPVWLFDLDDTLHHAGAEILPQINLLMTEFVARTLATDLDTASAIRADYWRRYGATLLGMIRHHGTSADAFLAATHAFDNLPAMIRAERGVVRRLRSLPGRKILLTNAPTAYAADVLRHLRLALQFDRQVAIEQMAVHGRLRPKPDLLMLRRLLVRLRIAPARAILVEDTLSHLKRYKRLGLRTVWMTGYLSGHGTAAGVQRAGARGRKPGYVDVKVRSLAALRRTLR